jgi:hypothetical protein
MKLLFYLKPRLSAETQQEFDAVVREHGPLLTPYMASVVGGVSRQRIYELIELDRFTKVVAFGIVMVPMREIENFRETRRGAGRPRKLSSGHLRRDRGTTT